MPRWKQIPGWERYEVSNEGQIRSRDIEVNAAIGGRAVRRGRILKPVPKDNGYVAVTLTAADGTRKQIAIHRLVLLAFRGITTSYTLHTRHRDNDRSNNRLRNLLIGTPKMNCADKVRHGTDQIGIRHGMAKLTEEQARALKFAPTRADAVDYWRANSLPIVVGHIDQIRQNRCWTHLKKD